LIESSLITLLLFLRKDTNVLTWEGGDMDLVIKESFKKIMESMKGAKVGVMKRQMDFDNERYDLSNKPAKG